MIDLHNHYLPGIDDGPAELTGSIELLEAAVDDGISHFMATPHINPGTFDNVTVGIAGIAREFYAQVPANLKQKISLHFAAEVRMCAELPIMLQSGDIPLLGTWNGKKVLLLEFPHSHIPVGAEQLIDWLLANGILPMIAHPERNRDIWKKPAKLTPFVKRGCLFQVTAGSITGDFGELSQQRALELIKQNIATVVASDSHSVKRRPPRMTAAATLISEHVSHTATEKLFSLNPARILEGNTHALAD
ncbi:MAG: tyrosine-protein phosphatase [Alteromonas oceani]